MMGDTVLFEDEVNPVMSAAFDNGLSVTALHNHFFSTNRRFTSCILKARAASNLATAVHKVYDKIKEVRAADPKPKSSFNQKSLGDKSSITAAPLNEIFGLQGEVKDGMVKFTIGHKAKMHDFEIANDMGVNTWGGLCRNR